MSNICIIPARGNSKRIKNKNIRIFDNKPIISFAIEAAFKSNLFDHVLVSTDSDKIAKIARDLKAEVPFLRPINLSDDFTDTLSVIKHSILECERFGWNFNFVCCLYPCVPFITKKDIIESLNLLNSSKDYFVFPIVESPSVPQRSLGIKKNDNLFSLFPEFESSRTQDLFKGYFDAGQFYWAHKDLWKESKSIHNNAKGLIIPKWRAIDIDYEDDWFMAELLYTIQKKRGEIESI